MHKPLLPLALLLSASVAYGQDHYGHAAADCPKGPNGPCPNKPKPAPEPAPEPAPHKPKPARPILPDMGLGLSDEDMIALLVATVLFGGALWYFIQSERKQGS